MPWLRRWPRPKNDTVHVHSDQNTGHAARTQLHALALRISVTGTMTACGIRVLNFNDHGKPSDIVRAGHNGQYGDAAAYERRGQLFASDPFALI